MKTKKKSPIKKYSKKISKIYKIKNRVNNTQKIVKKVDATNKVISDTLYIRGNFIIDQKNFSLLSITKSEDLY